MADTYYVGGYTASGGGTGQGITALRRVPATGGLEVLGLAAHTESPSFLAHHPSLEALYSVSELDKGSVSAWSVGADGSLAALGESRPTGGAHPCHVSVLPDGAHLVVTNYTGGSVAVHSLAADGSVGARTHLLQRTGSGPVADRQGEPHPHMTLVEPDGLIWLFDLGTDSVLPLRVDDEGILQPAGTPPAVPAGTGPRHGTRVDGSALYVVGELDPVVLGYAGQPRDASVRVPASSSTTPNQPSHIQLSADGSRLYVANRGPDTITTYAVDADAAGLEQLAEVGTQGHWPRHFGLELDALHVANERSHTVVTLSIGADGVPEFRSSVAVPSPSCVLVPRRQ